MWFGYKRKEKINLKANKQYKKTASDILYCILFVSVHIIVYTVWYIKLPSGRIYLLFIYSLVIC